MTADRPPVPGREHGAPTARTVLLALGIGIALVVATLGLATLAADDRCVVVSSPAGFPCAPERGAGGEG